MNFKEWSLWGLGILACLAVVVLIFGGGYYTAHQNMLKQEKMTQFCIQQGYAGWTDSNSSRYQDGESTCVRN